MRPGVSNCEEDVIFSPFVFRTFAILVGGIFPQFVGTGPFNEDDRCLLNASSTDECFVRFHRYSNEGRDTTYKILGEYKRGCGLSIQDGDQEGLQDKVVDRPLNNSTIDERSGRIRVPVPITNGYGLFSIKQPGKIDFVEYLYYRLGNYPALYKSFMGVTFVAGSGLHSVQ